MGLNIPSIPKVGGAVDDIAKALRPPHLHDDPNFVAMHLNAAVMGKLPTTEQAAKLKDSGVDFSKIIDDTRANAAPAFEAFSIRARALLHGVWLKFDDITFPTRLKGALHQKGESIEKLTQAIQKYERVALEGDDVVKSIDKELLDLQKMIKAETDPAVIERLTTRFSVKEAQRAGKVTQIAELRTAADKLETEHRLMVMEYKTDLEEADRLLQARDLGKKLEDLDESMQKTLDKFTRLQSDIIRIDQKVKIETAKAQRAAQQLNDSGGLIGKP